MTEVNETKETDKVLLEERLKKRVSVNDGKIKFLDETESIYPRVSELLTIVKVAQGDTIPKILIDATITTDAKRHMEEWNQKIETQSLHLSSAMYRMLLLGDFWGQDKNKDYYYFIANTKETAVAIFGDPVALSSRTQYEDIVPGLETQFYKELGIETLDDLSDHKP